jgi:Fe-S cluster assembly protein SufD
MNIHATTKTRTPAEQALSDAFAARSASLPGDEAVRSTRQNAARMLDAGLPTRKVESWHYTDLRRLLNKVPGFEAASGQAVALDALVVGSQVLTVVDGKAKGGAVEAATVSSLAERLSAGGRAVWREVPAGDDTVAIVNQAFMSDGFDIDIPAGAELENPVEIQNISTGGQAHSRFSVQAGAGSKAILVERQSGDKEALVSSVSHLDVGDGAEILWVIVQEQGADSSYLGQINVRIGKDANLTLFIMNTGGKLVRQEVRVVAGGEGSTFTLRGVNLLGGSVHCDVTMVLDHDAPHTNSTEIIRNVVTDKAQGAFQGQIRVAQQAQKTDAKMSCNTLLLSDDAEFSAKPELEIFADDVACGHGATVTEIDPNHLFYLNARGVPEKEARGLLVKAFVAEIIEELEHEALVEALERRLDGWFATHG